MHLLVARELGVEPEECLAIEDSPAESRPTLAAGAEIVAVSTDLTRQKFRDINRCVTLWRYSASAPRQSRARRMTGNAVSMRDALRFRYFEQGR